MAGLKTEQELPYWNLRPFSSAFEDSLKAGDDDGLLAFLTSPEGRHVPRYWDDPTAIAATNGDTRCLRVFRQCGFVLGNATWAEAAEHGRIYSLAFAMSHGYKLPDSVLEKAVRYGHVACVEFLLQQGVPQKPYMHAVYPARPDQLKCIQLMLDKQVAVDPQTLIVAAARGDLDFVRWLHQRGLPLWDQAQDRKPSRQRDPVPPTHLWAPEPQLIRQQSMDRPGTLYIPCVQHVDMWKTLRYGAGHGAPISVRARRILEEKRRQTHAVLLCFKAAAGLCQVDGHKAQRRMWAGMAALDSALVEELLIAADLEIMESVMRRSQVETTAVPDGASRSCVPGGL